MTVINIDAHRVLADGTQIEALTCKNCGCQLWAVMMDEDNCAAVFACGGVMEDGSKCECVIDLDEVEWIDQ